MSTLLAEYPLLTTLMLGALGAALLYAWMQGGRRAAAVGGVVVLALIPVAWFVADKWVTDRERIEQILHQAAADVESNNHDAAVDLIADPATRLRAKSELARYDFTEARITGIQRIGIVDGSNPLEAEVELTVKARVSGAGLRVSDMTVVRRLWLTMQRRGTDRWVVVDYRHGPITGGTDPYSSYPP